MTSTTRTIAVNDRVTHAYSGGREGTVTAVRTLRNGKVRVAVQWDGGKPATHDASLIRPGGR